METLPQDQSNGWTAELSFPEFPQLNQSTIADVVVIGGGYTGVSACIELQRHYPHQRVILLDAHQPGRGASARNSGYLVDSTLNDGHLSDAGLQAYASKYALARRALEHVQDWVQAFAIPCQWNACGKFHAAHGHEQLAKLERFSKVLDSLGLEHGYWDATQLTPRLGTSYYRHAVWTAGAVMLQPAQLMLGLLNQLRSVGIYGDSPVVAVRPNARGVQVQTPQGQIQAQRVLVCTNAGLRELGHRRTFPLYLTASLTRVLDRLPEEYGVLSAQAMGATLRVTQDRRIMIRNTAEVGYCAPQTRQADHLRGLQRRFDWIKPEDIEHTWGGFTCISGNSANVFEQTHPRVWQAGCYNGGGIGLGCLFGAELARWAMGEASDAREQILARPRPNWLPPQPFLNAGVRIRLARDRRRAQAER